MNGIISIRITEEHHRPPLRGTCGEMEITDGGVRQRAIRIPDAEDPIEKVRITGGEAPKLVAAFAEGDLDLVIGGTVGDLPYALGS